MDTVEIYRLMFKSIFDVIFAIPSFFWIIIFIGIGIKIFNSKTLTQRNKYSLRGKSDLDIFFENIWFLLFDKNKISKTKIENLSSMKGKQFEWYLYWFFRNKGYWVKRVGTSYSDHRGDFGGDLIFIKDGIKTVVQAKNYIGLVGVNAVREVIGARDYYKCDNAIVITTSSFSNDAIIQARASNIDLWDSDRLNQEISNK